jgi:uncharacterized protein
MKFHRVLAIQTSPIHGLGLFALVPFARGSRIIEYTGERITHQEAYDRYAHTSNQRRNTYLFAVNERTVIDATHSTGVARFINHSFKPNSQSTLDGTRIFIEAIRKISPGTEITYDYRLEIERDSDGQLKKFYECCCGSEACRGLIYRRARRRRACV